MIQILFSILLSASAFAHDKPVFELDFSKQNVEISDEGKQSLIHQSHELIEGDESGTFWQRWRGAAMLKAKVVDGVRWASSVPNGTYRNLAIDSLFLFGLSHTTEMSSGPVLLAIGYNQNWPDWAMGLTAAGGTLISIPGFDPLCMVVFAFYAKSETFRASVGWLRLAALRGVGKFARFTGLNDYVAKKFARPAVRPYLESLDGLQSIVGGEEGSLDFNYSFSGIDLTVHFQNDKAYLEQVTFTGSAVDLKAVRQFGWNAQDLIRALAHNRNLEKPYLARTGDTYIVSPNAVSVRAKRGCEAKIAF